MPATVQAEASGQLLVSIVVCTYNRAELVRGALQSLMQLRLPEVGGVEILVIDNASTDHTSSVLAGIVEGAPRIETRYVLEDRQGVAHARNRGIAEARGEWLAFFDDDQIADVDWLVQLLAAADDRQTLCVGGSVKLLLPDGYDEPLSSVCRVLLSESPAGSGACPYRGSRTPGTGNLLVRRTLVSTLGGFDTGATMGGEDTDLFRRIRAEGVVAWYEPRAVIYHRVPSERLTNAYMVWNARRTGVHVADLEHRVYGTWRFPLRFAMRFGQACLKGPRFLWKARFAKQASERIAGRCVVAATIAYIRRTGQWLFPSVLPQTRYFESLDFRAEREMFGS